MDYEHTRLLNLFPPDPIDLRGTAILCEPSIRLQADRRCRAIVLVSQQQARTPIAALPPPHGPAVAVTR
jgi:hypothetical protein